MRWTQLFLFHCGFQLLVCHEVFRSFVNDNLHCFFFLSLLLREENTKLCRSLHIPTPFCRLLFPLTSSFQLTLPSCQSSLPVLHSLPSNPPSISLHKILIHSAITRKDRYFLLFLCVFVSIFPSSLPSPCSSFSAYGIINL